MTITKESIRPVSARVIAAMTCVLLLPSLAFVTNQSLWADEACSAWFAAHARSFNPAQFPGMLGAVSQMPGYHVLLLGWIRIAGDSERALRALNIPFAALFLASLLTLCRERRAALWWVPAAPFAFFPLLTYYTNEARPYAALLGLSAAAATALLIHIKSGSRRAAWVCALCSLAAFSFHLLGVLTLLTLAFFLLLTGGFVRHLRTLAIPLLTTLPGYMALLPYYARVHGAGTAHATGVALQSQIPGNVTATWRNCAFVLYEALGFAGLGPPRNDLRLHAGISSFQDYWPTMLLGGAGCVALVWLLRTKVFPARRLLAAAAAGLGVLFLLARVSHFGFFGRHAMPLIGCFCCAIVVLLARQDRAVKGIALVLGMIWATSSARLLFAYRYAKDDPRAAMATAEEQASPEHLPVFWNAGREEAVYYNAFDPERADDLLFTLAPAIKTAHGQRLIQIHILGPQPEPVTAGDAILVQGKADTFDPTGYWTALRQEANSRLLAHYNGFEIYRVHMPGAHLSERYTH